MRKGTTRNKSSTSALEAAPYVQMSFDFSSGTIVGEESGSSVKNNKTEKGKKETGAISNRSARHTNLKQLPKAKRESIDPRFVDALMAAIPEDRFAIEESLKIHGVYSNETLKVMQDVYTGWFTRGEGYTLDIKRGVGPVIRETTEDGRIIHGMWHPMIAYINDLIQKDEWLTKEERAGIQIREEEEIS